VNENCPEDKRTQLSLEGKEIKPIVVTTFAKETPINSSTIPVTENFIDSSANSFSDEQNGVSPIEEPIVETDCVKEGGEEEASSSVLFGGGILAALITKEGAAGLAATAAIAKTVFKDDDSSEEQPVQNETGAVQKILEAVEEANKGTVLDNSIVNNVTTNTTNIVNEVSQILTLPDALPDLLGNIPKDDKGLFEKTGDLVDDVIMTEPLVGSLLKPVDDLLQLDSDQSPIKLLTEPIEGLLGNSKGISSLASVFDLSIVNNNLNVSE